MTRHAMRYPKHEGDKGTVWGGECNRTACLNGEAFHWNAATYGYYCRGDARAINWGHPIPLCVSVDHDLSIEEMDARAKTDAEARYGVVT